MRLLIVSLNYDPGETPGAAAPPKFLGLVHERLLLSKAAAPENILSSSEHLFWGEGQGGACCQDQQLL